MLGYVKSVKDYLIHLKNIQKYVRDVKRIGEQGDKYLSKKEGV